MKNKFERKIMRKYKRKKEKSVWYIKSPYKIKLQAKKIEQEIIK